MGVAVATARVDRGATAVTMTGTRVTVATNDHREENQGAIRSHEALPLAFWEEPKLLYLIATSSSCRERSRQHNQA
jgi:hypothetical protein